MKTRQFAKVLGPIAALGLIVLAVSSISHAKAESEESLAKIGFKIAPVPLNMMGKNPELVGYGSYLVNVVGGCNGCHSAGPATEYAAGGNPYLSQTPARVNPATYLGGTRDFGQLIPGTANIMSRNLTPDKTGLPAGGRTFQEFLTILRTGVDLDMAHPNCPGAPGPDCLLRPFDGSLLQIMPWPTLRNMSNHDIRAIYEYLRTIPCVSGPPAPSLQHNDCQ